MMHLKTTLSVLAIAAVATMAQDKAYSGAELHTNEEYQYGKFEARMKMAAISGTVSSMFLYQDGSEKGGGRPWVEVDIEILGKNPNSFQSNIISGSAESKQTSEKHHKIEPGADQSFHTYGIEWTPNYVRWTIDGNEVRKTEKGVNDNKNQVESLTGTQGLRFNLWSSEDPRWVGNFEDYKLPIYQYINWVKVYKYTPNQGENGSDFTLDWADNFENFDENRWGKGTWSFDGNRVTFSSDNIVTRNGMAILSLTRKGEEGFNGQVPQDLAGDEEFNNGTQQQSSSSEAISSSSSSSSEATSSSSSAKFNQNSSSSATTFIQNRVKPAPATKEIRGTVNAKGVRVNEANKAHYQVDFNF